MKNISILHKYRYMIYAMICVVIYESYTKMNDIGTQQNVDDDEYTIFIYLHKSSLKSHVDNYVYIMHIL